MKFILLISIALGTVINVIAQESPIVAQGNSNLGKECAIDAETEQKIFTRLEIIAAYRGGSSKWFQFAQKNFDFDKVLNKLPAETRVFQDSIVLRFVVRKEGDVCAVVVEKGNQILAESAINLVRLARWEPGLNGSRQINSLRTLRIDVRIDNATQRREILKLGDSYYRYND